MGGAGGKTAAVVMSSLGGKGGGEPGGVCPGEEVGERRPADALLVVAAVADLLLPLGLTLCCAKQAVCVAQGGGAR